MNTISTLQTLANFTQNEKQLLEEAGLIKSKGKSLEPKQTTVNNILNYSKTLSVRKSKFVKTISFVNN